MQEVFSELGALVSAQQSNVDDIESQVVAAAENTKAGKRQLQQATDSQKKLNSCYVYCLAFCIVALLFVFLFVFWGKITGNDDGN